MTKGDKYLTQVQVVRGATVIINLIMLWIKQVKANNTFVEIEINPSKRNHMG